MRKQEGFTIVEFMIATAVFSMVLLLCSFAIIHVGRMFYKGIITNRTQDTARRVMDDISRGIQFGVSSPNFRSIGFETNPTIGDIYSLCLGNVRYTYSTDHAMGQIPHVLWKDQGGGGGSCTPLDISQENPPGSVGGVELLGENMRVGRLEAVELNGAWVIDVRIAHGDNEGLFEEDFDGDPALPEDKFGICKGGTATGQFCAVSQLNTTVVKRL